MKQSTLLLFLIFSLSIHKTHAQAPPIQWQKSLGGTSAEKAFSIQETTDDGYIIAGSSNSNNANVTGNHGQDDYWVVKLNSIGTIQWQKSLGGSGVDNGLAVQQTTDNGFIVIGASNSNDGDVTGNHGGVYDTWVVKLDALGTIQWQKCLGGSGYENGYTIEQISDGGYIIAGSSNSNDGDVSGNHGGFDSWVVKLSNIGVIEWQKSLGGSGNDYGYSIKQTRDNGFILGGYSDSNDGDVTGNHGAHDYWVVKLDNLGNIQWQKSLGGSGVENGQSIQQTFDGGYIIAGHSNSNDGDVTGNHGDHDFWVVKLNIQGGIQWQKSLGGSLADWCLSVTQTIDGGYIAAGWSVSNDGDITNNHGESDYWIVKLNELGNVEWQTSIGGSFADYGSLIQQTSDVGYIVVGYSFSNDGDVSGNNGDYDFWVAKLFPVGSFIRGSVFTDSNSNCGLENGETNLSQRIIQGLPSLYYATTDSLGNYLLWVGTGNNTISLIPKLYWTQDCPFSGNYTGVNAGVESINFSSYVSTICADVRIGIGTSSQLRCFNDNQFTINVCNQGTAVANDATISLQFPPLLIPQTSSMPWTNGQTGEYIFNVGNLQPEECIQYTVTNTVSCGIDEGTTVCVSAHVVIEPQAADCNLQDNFTSECIQLVGSFDPNDKQVASQDFQTNGYVTSEDFMLGDTLTYLIRFQNTGNDTAFIVIVRDTLSQWVDPTTVVTDVASHPYDFRITGQGVLEWTFNNILLPDSNVNEAASHGFIKYHIMPRDTMPPGGEIHNEADIYFDYNDPVITNETVSTLAIVIGDNEMSLASTIKIYPNPTTSEITVIGYSAAYLKLSNILGQTVAEISKSNKLWLGNLPQGLYLLQLFDEKGGLVKTEKVVKE